MADAQPHRLTMLDLEAALRAADAGALLTPARIVRRVIRNDRALGGLGLRAPHRKTYTIDTASLFALVDRDELDPAPPPSLPERVILLAAPSPESLAETPSDRLLVKYWRLLFHGAIHAELEGKIARGELTSRDVRERISRLGQTEFDEIRAVLRQEEYLLPPADDRATYVEFCAVFAELLYFSPALLRSYFPALDDLSLAEETISLDVNPAEISERTRPEGAPREAPHPTLVDEPQPETPPPPEGETNELPSARRYHSLIALAAKAASLGNHVKAALARTRASGLASRAQAGEARSQARRDIEALVGRLREALDFSPDLDRSWVDALVPFLEVSTRGFWRREHRLLYDLQKACVDHEREIHVIDLVEWVLSLFRRPIKRSLPGQREVLLSKHLRTAQRRLLAARVPEESRRTLERLFRDAVSRAETRLRDRFRGEIEAALSEVGLVPRDPPERVARRKLVEELLDRVVERGFLSMFDLRDAIARNHLKIPDLWEMAPSSIETSAPASGKGKLGVFWQVAKTFLFGDRLLRADRALAVHLDGVYRRGEVYLRWSQRLSSLAFGTRGGRVFVRFVALPYGGAFVGLFGLHFLAAEIAHFVFHREIPQMAAGSMSTLIAVALIGAFLFGLLHAPPFRAACQRQLLLVAKAIHFIVLELPSWIGRIPWVRSVLDSRWFRWVKRWLLKPALYTGLTMAAVDFGFDRWRPSWEAAFAGTSRLGVTAALFLAVNLLINSRMGRTLEEMLTDWVVRSWDQFRIRVLATLLQAVLDFFDRLLDWIDRLLYSVDEWLRFKSGQGRLTMILKGALGVVWFFVTYLIRLFINLCAEPQLNPIKHFPVVTVSHKLMFPISVPLSNQFESVVGPKIGDGLAWAIGLGAIQLLPPGFFGFLAWELRENWRIYEANRPDTLRPAPIGAHGETLLRFLKLGFHSGTLPKLYARLRRSDRKSLRSGKWSPATRKTRRGLREVEEAIRRFVEREFIGLLEESRRWDGPPIHLGEITTATNVIRLEIHCPGVDAEPARIAFEEQSGWLLASVPRPGWLAKLDEEKLAVVTAALVGLYKLAGVDFSRERLESAFKPETWRYDISDEGLVAWPKESEAAAESPRAVYDLTRGPMLVPENPERFEGAKPRPPSLDRSDFVFSGAPVPWELWVEAWRDDEDPDRGSRRFGEATRLLPVVYRSDAGLGFKTPTHERP